jgi:hypothetical protein
MNLMSVTRALVVALILCLCVPAIAEVHGVLRVVKGEVQIKSGSTGVTSRAKLGQEVYPKDTIITGKDARAKVVMIDNNELNISPDSHVEIQNYQYNPAENKKNVLLNVLYGKVRSKVEQKYDGRTSKFQVKTPSAVAGVRGTDFVTSYSQITQKSTVITFRGAVEFGLPGSNGLIQSAVSVTPGKMAEISGNSAPGVPSTLPKEQLAKFDHETKVDSTTSGPSSNDPRAPATDKDSGKSDKGSGDSSSSSNSNSSGSASTSNSSNSSTASSTSNATGGNASSSNATGTSASASNSTTGPTSGDSSRAPASATPTAAPAAPAAPAPIAPAAAPMSIPTATAGSGSMLIGSDLASAPSGTAMLSNIPKAPTAVPVMNQPSVTVPTTVIPQTSQFQNGVVQSGNTNLTIHVNQ